MEFVVTTARTFVIGFLLLLAVMLVVSIFVSHQFQPWLAAGLSAGVALASIIRAKWSLSTNASALLYGLLAYAGSFIGHWLTAHV